MGFVELPYTGEEGVATSTPVGCDRDGRGKDQDRFRQGVRFTVEGEAGAFNVPW